MYFENFILINETEKFQTEFIEFIFYEPDIQNVIPVINRVDDTLSLTLTNRWSSHYARWWNIIELEHAVSMA